MINTVNLQTDAESRDRELTLKRWVYHTLKNWANEGNGTKSKGLVVYEAMQFSRDDVTDNVDSIESHFNSELEKEGIDVNHFNNISMNNFGGESDLIKHVPDHIDPYDKVRNISIWMLKEFDDSLDFERYWSQHIGNALIHVAQSAFVDRTDRINAKRELLNYVREQETPEHPVISNLVQNVNSTYDFPSELISSITTQKPIYERIDGFGWEELEQECGSMTQWEDREQAVVTAYRNMSIPREDIVDIFTATWGIADKYAKNKVDTISKKYNLDIKNKKEQKEEKKEKIESKIEDKFALIEDRYGEISINNLKKYCAVSELNGATPKIINRLIHNTDREITILELRDMLKDAGIKLPHEYVDMSDMKHYGTNYSDTEFEIWVHTDKRVKLEVNDVHGTVRRIY